MKRTILALAGVLALMLGGIASAVPASAAAPDNNDLKIVQVGTDAMGADSFSNRNREFVKFENVSSADLDIANVIVEDNWARTNSSHTCNTYKITDLPGNDTTVIAAGATVTVYNGSRWGGDRRDGNAYHLYAKSDVDCGTFGHFFNNDADTAWVVHGNTVLAKKSWDWNGGYHVAGSDPLP
ncbi:hypothetical protein AB0I81_22410 [Nonomuraea sp. NPDC050404]|uniref:hypothetical protein n=1 Tax=Nonomuraea sp. NPDC050404 TaxID=3155783 RepID=UPI00340E4276